MANSSTITTSAATNAQAVSFTLDTTGSSDGIYARPGKDALVQLGGTCGGTVSVDLSVDGSTWRKCALDATGTVELTVSNPSVSLLLAVPNIPGIKAVVRRVTAARAQ